MAGLRPEPGTSAKSGYKQSKLHFIAMYYYTDAWYFRDITVVIFAGACILYDTYFPGGLHDSGYHVLVEYRQTQLQKD